MAKYEVPLSFKEHCRRHPKVPMGVMWNLVYSCKPSGEPTRKPSRPPTNNYLPSDVDAKVKGWCDRKAKAVPPGTKTKKIGGVSYAIAKELGITTRIGNDLHAAGRIREPVTLPVQKSSFGEKTPAVLIFYAVADVEKQMASRNAPMDEWNIVRTTAQLENLPVDAHLTHDEVKGIKILKHLVGDGEKRERVLGDGRAFSDGYLRPAHTQFDRSKPDTRQKHQPTKSLPIGRVISGKLSRTRLFSRKRGKREYTAFIPVKTYRIGDLRDIMKAVESPAIPEGAKLLRDAMPALAKIGIRVTLGKLIELIRSKVVHGDKVDGFNTKFLPCKMWWMMWEDRSKIPQRPRPGNRVLWKSGKCYYPDIEACALACCEVTNYTAKKMGGKGWAHPKLGRCIGCEWIEEKGVTRDKLKGWSCVDVLILEADAKGFDKPRPTPVPPITVAPPEATSKAKRGEAPVNVSGSGKDTSDKFLKAVILKKENPNLSQNEIAKRVGMDSGTLGRNSLWKSARMAWEGDKSSVRRGYRNTNGTVDASD